MATAFFCLVNSRSIANRLRDELHRCGVSNGDVSLCFLAGGAIPAREPSLARVEGYKPPRARKLVATGHFEWGLKGTLTSQPAGSITRVLTAMGVPREESRTYEAYVQEGWVLLSVFCHDLMMAKKVKMTLQRAEAVKVASIGRAFDPATAETESTDS